MNTHTPIAQDDNSRKKFSEFQPQLDDIGALVRKSDTHKQEADDAVFNALGKALDLGLRFAELRDQDDDQDWSLFKDFLEANGERWSTKCDTCFMHGLAAVAFNQVDEDGDPLVSAPTLSRFRSVLRFAYETNLSGEKLITELKAKTLNEYYKTALSHFRYDPLDEYVENDDVRFERALRHLVRHQNTMPKVAYNQQFSKPQSFNGFATAIVRVRNNGMQIVGFTDEGDNPEEAIKSKVSALVPAEAKRRRKKLSDKKLYWLYVTCDLYSRFLPKFADRRAWAKAAELANVPLMDATSTDEEIREILAQYAALGDARAAKSEAIAEAMKHPPNAAMRKFAYLDALEFSSRDGTWLGRTISTHPNTPCIEVLPGMPPSQTKAKIAMKGTDAQKFVSDFPRFEAWGYKMEEGIGRLSYIAAGSKTKASSAVLQDLSSVANWRCVDPQLQPVAKFKLDRQHLHALEHWRAKYAEAPKIGRKAFQTILRVETKDDELLLAQPLDQAHHQTLGTLQSGTTPEFDQPRFLDYRNCLTLVSLALDYGTEFEFELLDGHDGISAIRVHPIDFPVDASVVLPLMLSNKGNPAEITASVRD